ncbi:MAG: hypothetical protein JW839_00250, partial [Candidatus Lokiarchaeota archaeon]|nr:hypothetical protein [Candidatus Lokiarchaeota archaeon]
MSVVDPSGLRKRIVDAIRRAGMPCWLTFSGGTFGVAGFVEFQTDRAYMEALFFPKQHPKHPVTLSIISKVLPVNEIVLDVQHNLQYLEGGVYVDPFTVLDRIDRFRLAYIDSAMDLLNKERGLVEAAYETSGRPGDFRQGALLHLQDTSLEVSVDYARYPVAPRVEVPRDLLQRAGLQDVSELSALKAWEPTGNLHVVAILDELCTRAWKGDGKLAQEYQVLDVSGVEVPGLARIIGFKLPRGRVAGIAVEGSSGSTLVSALACMPGGGAGAPAVGQMRIFGKPAAPGDACAIDATPPQGSAGRRVAQLLAGSLAGRGRGALPEGVSMRALVDASGLGLAVKERVGTLTRMDLVKLNIARNVLLGRRVFFVDFDTIGINRLEHAPYMKVMRAVAR